MAFPTDLAKYALTFKMGDVKVTVIDANHGIFSNSFPRHMHSFYELHYIASGKGVLRLDDRMIPLQKGDLFLLGPQVNHEQITDITNPMEEYHLSFRLTALHDSPSDIRLSLFSDESCFYAQNVTTLEPLFRELEQELSTKRLGFLALVQTYISQILIHSLRSFSPSAVSFTSSAYLPDNRRSLLLDEAFLYSYKTITLKDLAALLHLSERHTARLIQEKYGMTFSRYKQLARLNVASRLLEEGMLSLNEIAESCGFSNYSHFYIAFRKHFQVSPSFYRKSRTKSDSL